LLCAFESGAQTLHEKLQRYESFYASKNNQNIEEADTLTKIRLFEAIETNDKARTASLQKELGMIQLTRFLNYAKAIDYFIAALATEDSINLREDQVITYIAMARVFEEVGDYYKSAELLEHAMSLNEKYANVPVLVYLANRLGQLNAKVGNLNAAYENYELVLTKKESPSDEAQALFNIAQLLTIQDKHAQALEHHKRALGIRRTIKDRKNEAQSLNAIGELYVFMKNTEKALANYVVALRIREDLKDEKGIAESYNNIGHLYYTEKKWDRAVANLTLALNAANTSQMAEQQLRSHELLSLCYKEVRDFERALSHKDAYLELAEFMRRERAESEILETQNRYVLQKKELEIRKLEILQKQREHELNMQRKLQNFLFALIGFGFIIIMLVFYLYLIKRRSNISLEAAHARVNMQNQQLTNLNATKDKFFSIISHDLKGPLNSFTAFSKMLIEHTESMTKEEIQMLAREIDKNLKNVYALLENLLEWSRSQTGNIEFKPEDFDIDQLLVQNMELLQTQAANKQIIIEYASSSELTVTGHKHSLNTVIRNLISNAIKFTPPGGRIILTVQRESNFARISITDTGVGMSPATLSKLFRIDTKYSTNGTANEKGTGLGLILCKDFVEKNGGKLSVESTPGKGSVFSFTTVLSNNQPSAEIRTEAEKALV